MAQPRRLHKSRDDKMLSGVSGGMAEYFDIDPVFVRPRVGTVRLRDGRNLHSDLYRHGDSRAKASLRSPRRRIRPKPPMPRSLTNPLRDPGNAIATGWESGWLSAGVAILLSNLNILSLRSVEWGVLAAIAVIALGAVLLFMSLRNRN